MTLVGYQAGLALTEGAKNTIVGYQAGVSLSTGTQATYVGYKAGNLATAGSNTAVGYQALMDSTGGASNTAVGQVAGENCTGDNNVFLGAYAGFNNNEQDNNVYVGSNSGANLDDGGNNTAIGKGSMQGPVASNDAANNVAVGYNALNAITDGTTNVAVGSSAGLAITSATNCVLLGNQAGDTLTTGANNTFLGFHTEASAVDVTYEIIIGAGVDSSNAFAGAGTETVKIGRTSDFITCDFGENATWSHSSDIRIKKDIEDSELGLSFINDLRPVIYKKKSPSEYPKEFDGYDANETERKNPDRKHYGFIAQEVKEAMDKAGHSEFPVWSEGKDGMQELGEAELITPLIKAVQELSAKVEELEAKLSE